MATFFDLFPKVPYNTGGKQLTTYDTVTNVFFRLRVLKSVLDNISAYYEHTVQDGDTPEILAEKVYGNPEAHWIILLANEIVDPQYGWPLDSRSFNKYIINKYGSVQTAKTTIHHYEKVIIREESFSGTITETRFVVDYDQITENAPDAPYDRWTGLPSDQFVETFNMGGGRTVIQTIKRDQISNYDWEVQENEKKRLIKIIKPEYYSQIINEFNELTNFANAPFIRRLF